MFLGMPWALQTKIEAALASFIAAQRAKAVRDLAEVNYKYYKTDDLLNKAIEAAKQQ